VFIDENNNSQIAICDQHKLYIYDYENNIISGAADSRHPDGAAAGF
jgi:hypothetical protein